MLEVFGRGKRINTEWLLNIVTGDPFFLDEKLGMEEKFEVGRGPQLEKSFRK